MQEMMELSKIQSREPEAPPQSVSFPMKDNVGIEHTITVQARPAHFGMILKGKKSVTGNAVIVNPFRACNDLQEKDRIHGKIAIMERGDCIFIEKVRKVSANFFAKA